MLLKIHLLHVMSISLITVQIKAQGPSLAEVPELYMIDSDKAFFNNIWNMAGFPSYPTESEPEVTRKFFGILTKVAPLVIKNVIPNNVKVPNYIKKVAPGFIKTSIKQLGEIPGFPDQIKPVLPAIAKLVPEKFGKLIDLTGTKHTNNNNRQRTRIDRSYADSPITRNYKVLPKPSNSKFASNRRALYLENADLEISDRNFNNRETNAKYYLTENLKTSHQDLKTVNRATEQMKRMMQFQGENDNKHINKKSSNFLQRKIHQNMNAGERSYNTTAKVAMPYRSRKNHRPFEVTNIRQYNEEVALENRNSHKKAYNTSITTRFSKTSSYHPIGVSHKWIEKRKELNRTSDKSHKMLQNNQTIHNVERYNPMMHKYPNEPRRYLFQQLRDVRASTVDRT